MTSQISCKYFAASLSTSNLWKAISFLAVISLPLGCGGGSSSGSGNSGSSTDVLQSIPYTGVTSAAVITADNAGELMMLTKFGNLFSFENSDILAANSSQSGFMSATPSSSNTASDSTPGDCGGWMHVDMTINEVSGDFQGKAVFEQYDDCQSIATGTALLSGQVNIDSLTIIRMTMSFELMEVLDVALGEQIWSGRFTIAESQFKETHSFDLRLRVVDTDKVYWFDNYQITVTHGYESRSYEEHVITSGRFYDPDRGYLDLHSLDPVRTYYDDDWPDRGSIVYVGSNDASIRLNIHSSVIYQVQMDVDGDDIYEIDIGRFHFPGANTLPLANTGEYGPNNVGCPILLDGSMSSDADQDPLIYEWSLASAPEGSTSPIFSASSPIASFTPDVKGDYKFSLSVFDGFSSVGTVVDLTVYGDLFCLNKAINIPYALAGQYEADITVGDVTTDGLKDVLAMTREAELYVFSQYHSGELADPKIYKIDNWRAVAVGDVTGDGRNDAVVPTSDGVGVLNQSAVGQLEDMVIYPFVPPLPNQAYSYSLALGDFNNDMKLDVALLPENQAIYVFLQESDGSLALSLAHNLSTGGWSRILAGDVTGDGLTDILVSRADSIGEDNIGVLPQDPISGFGTPIYYTIGNLPYTYTSVETLGDLNNDGRLDLTYSLSNFSDESFNQVGVLFQNSSGTFDEPTIYQTYYPPIYDIVIVDVTGDERNDLVLLHGTPPTSQPFSPTTIAVHPATEDGSLSPYDIYPLPETPQSWGGMAVGDINGDGLNDIVASAHLCQEFNCGPSLVVLYGRSE